MNIIEKFPIAGKVTGKTRKFSVFQEIKFQGHLIIAIPNYCVNVII